MLKKIFILILFPTVISLAQFIPQEENPFKKNKESNYSISVSSGYNLNPFESKDYAGNFGTLQMEFKTGNNWSIRPQFSIMNFNSKFIFEKDQIFGLEYNVMFNNEKQIFEKTRLNVACGPGLISLGESFNNTREKRLSFNLHLSAIHTLSNLFDVSVILKKQWTSDLEFQGFQPHVPFTLSCGINLKIFK